MTASVPVSLGGLTGALQVFEGWVRKMAIKQKYLIVWIIALVVATFIANHFLGCLAAGLEHFVACGLGSSAIFGKFSAATGFVGSAF